MNFSGFVLVAIKTSLEKRLINFLQQPGNCGFEHMLLKRAFFLGNMLSCELMHFSIRIKSEVAALCGTVRVE